MKVTANQLNGLDSVALQSNGHQPMAWKEKPEKLFEEGQFELWYQPVYQAENGAVVHNEVLLRWRDQLGNIYLPKEFMPAISRAGWLPRVDRLVIGKTIDSLAQNPELELSVNLSESTLKDLTIIEDLQSWLESAKVEPKRLSFEVTESAIATDFYSALQFIQGLKKLGCRVVIDDFSSRELSLTQCQQLAVDSVKLNQEFLQNLNTALAKAILEFGQSIGSVTAKCITDDNTLKLVKEAGLSRLQGNRLKMATPYPERMPWQEQNQLEIIDLTPHSLGLDPNPPLLPSEKQEKTNLLKRFLLGTTFIGLGVAASLVGLLSIRYRMSNLVVDNSQINGRIIRLRAPIDGKVEAFYPRPGVTVKPNQVIARIGPSQEIEQQILQLEQEVKYKTNQLAAAEQSRNYLQSRLAQDSQEYSNLWNAETTRDGQDVSQKKALVDQAIAQANADRADYERLQKLYEQGAVTKQRADQAKAAWEVSQAGVRQAKEILGSAQTALNDSQNKVAMNVYSNWADGLMQEQIKLRSEIANEEILINNLRADLEVAKNRLAQARLPYGERKEMEVKAPIAGVIYSTDREEGEIIQQSEEILSLLDCNNVWVDAIVDAKEATRINTKEPVLVEMAGEAEPIEGEVNLIQALSSQGDFERSQRLEVEAILPPIPAELVGKPLSRIKVKIPPSQNYASDAKFCGLGQPARLTFAVNDESSGKNLLGWKPDWLRNGAKPGEQSK